ncbi:MAG: hypothetical protein A2Y12_08780 [Planctomycetes bacterium GWF2_42_9]|nr:MAG: hypothetical protein A2Y12_08780 [Planctomycetes bacterium GWF2_42_9]HAL45492.1 hypothetical protein [Phycisphaerales bacterium]
MQETNQDQPIFTCPKCQKELEVPTVIGKDKIERMDLNCRTIYGVCEKCGTVEIEQVTNDGNWWVTIQYRFYITVAKAWNKVNDYPVPPVVLGPQPLTV